MVAREDTGFILVWAGIALHPVWEVAHVTRAEFVVGVTNRRERKAGPKSLWVCTDARVEGL